MGAGELGRHVDWSIRQRVNWSIREQPRGKRAIGRSGEWEMGRTSSLEAAAGRRQKERLLDEAPLVRVYLDAAKVRVAPPDHQ
jgi:hypothetical protein